MDDKQHWVNLEWEGQKFYLPKYTKVYREIEKKFSVFLEEAGFEECLFPKLPTITQNFELKAALPRLSNEWSSELIDASAYDSIDFYPEKFTLAHWQCEPFYYFLKKAKPVSPVKFYDKSGWSYRVEKEINNFRLFEFQRIENVWCAPDKQSETILIDLIQGLNQVLRKFGLQTTIVEKFNEEIETKEKKVFDIEVTLDSYGKVELVGGHLHGRLFIENLGINVPNDFYTGCCGIGISRIVNAVLYLDL